MLKYFFIIILTSFVLFSDSAYSQVTNEPPFPGDTAAVVNGRVINRHDYVEMFTVVTTGMLDAKGSALTGEEIIEAHRQTWQNLINSAIVEDSIDKKGIVVTDKEIRLEL